MTSIAIFGGTGYAGGNIVAEASRRGHDVVSYTRHEPSQPVDGVDYRIGTLADADLVTKAAQEADQIVVAVHGADVDGSPLVTLVPQLTRAAIEAGARLSFVGGAASSLVAPGGPRLLDTPEFNEEWKPEATAHAEVLDALRQAPAELDWFYVSPPALFGAWAPGETTGEYRTGGDVLVTADDGTSEISGTDLARAYVDEIERGAHPRQRFTVGH